MAKFRNVGVNPLGLIGGAQVRPGAVFEVDDDNDAQLWFVAFWRKIDAIEDVDSDAPISLSAPPAPPTPDEDDDDNVFIDIGPQE